MALTLATLKAIPRISISRLRPAKRDPNAVPITTCAMVTKVGGSCGAARPERLTAAAIKSGPINCPAGILSFKPRIRPTITIAAPITVCGNVISVSATPEILIPAALPKGAPIQSDMSRGTIRMTTMMRKNC